MEFKWLRNNSDRVFRGLILNFIFGPILIALMFCGECGWKYFFAIGMGVPWIFTTVGSLIYYDRIPKDEARIKMAVDKFEQFTSAKICNRTDLAKEITEAKNELQKTKSLKEWFSRLSGIFKTISLITALLFFLSQSISKVFNKLLSLENEEVSVEQLNSEIDELNEELIRLKQKRADDQKTTKTLNVKLDSVIDELKKKDHQMNDNNNYSIIHKVKQLGPKSEL